MKANTITDPAKSIVASKPDVFNQKPQSDSTSASFGDEAQKLFTENNTNNKLNLNNNNKNKNNMELQSVNDDIFPKERQGGSSNYFNTELNIQSNIQINSNVNSPENTFEKNKEIILANDIPEMLLYKYNYDINLYKESLNDIDFEVEWMYDYLNMGKYNKKLIDPRDIKSCLKNLLTYHKVKKCDIPYIIANYESIYKKFFGQNEVFEILSVYDAEFLRLQKKRKKVLKFYEYIQKKNGEWELGKEIDKYYLQKRYILEAKTDLELDLIEALLGILTYVSQSNELDENCKAMINVEILKNLNIDYSLLNKVKDDKLDEIIKQFCLYPEQVVHNLKVINGEINDKIIEPPFPGCPLNDLCKKSMVETAGKYASTKDILMTSFQYYNLILALNPYIFNLIYKKLYDIYTLSTEPTEKGKEILNSLHPFYHCKRINKMPIKYFFEEKNDSLCNLYTKNFGEIFIDIEKCSNSGLIKYILSIPESPDETLNLKNILSKACNGLNDKMEIEENNSTNPNDKILKKKFIGARNLCLDNLLIISKGFFLNIIKTKLHNYSEKSLIKKISNEFFNIISRNLKGRISLDNAYIFSIIFNSQKNYFKLFIISPNWMVKQKKELHYIWKNDNLMEGGFEIALNSSEEQVELHKYLTSYCPKAIVLDVSNLESYKMINFIRNKFRDYNLIYSDYNSKIYKMKSYQMTLQQEEQTAVEQVRYVINPVNQIIDLWRYKYEDNLLLNLSLHPLQDNIKDIPLLCYSLETQVIRVVNSKGIYLNDLTRYSFNLFNFVSGFGPSTSSLIIKNLRNPNELTNSLRKNCPNIYNNAQMFLLENKILPFNLYKLNRNEEETGLLKSEIFSAMIKDKIYFKKLSLCNAVVNNVDLVNRVIHCYLLRGENNIKALLRFIDMDTNIKNPQLYFYPQRIILCKIIDISLRHNSYEIYITNKNEELISVKDFFLDQCKNANSKIAEKYTTLEEDDFIIKDIQKLKETQKLNEEKNIDEKKLKYSLISLENEQILRNVTFINMKKIIRMDYVVRPSFRGDNYLILSFYLIDDIYLNYDIEIITKKEQNEESNNTITEYKLGNNIYNSLTDLVNKFASKMKNSIENFRKNDYFKKPEEIRELFTKIFGIENPKNSLMKKEKNKIEIKIKKKEYEKDNIKTNAMNVIILGFMKEEPEYGIIFTKTSDELNYTLDFIKFMCNGYLFHGVFYTNLNEIIFFLKEKRKTPQYQNFLKNQFICTTHKQIEEIDEEYFEFDGIDPNLEKYNKSTISYNDLNNLKNNLLSTNNNDNNNKNLLGKKRSGDDIWGNDIGNNNDNNAEDVWGVSNENNNEDNGWNIKTENKEENNWGGNDLNENNENAWGVTTDDNKTDKKNISEWNTDLNNNNDWADGNNNDEGNNDWNTNNNNNNNKRQNNKFNNKKSYSNGSNKNDKFEKPRNNGFNNNKNKKFNNNNNRNKGNFDWKNKDKKNKESSFSWGNNNNQEQNNDNWNSGNNNKENNNTSDNWAKDNNADNQNDYWGTNTDANNEWNTGSNNKNDTWDKNDNKANNAWEENKNDTWGDNNTNNQWNSSNDNNKNKKDEWNNNSNNIWGKNNNNKKDGWNKKKENNSDSAWGSNNANDEWPSSNKNEWGSNDNNNANDSWGKGNNNKNDEWGSSNNKNDEWGSSNNNKNDEWGSSNNNKNDEWGSNNNNENNWNKNENENGWPSNDNNNNINDPWSESKENKNKTNISSWDSWDGNNTKNEKKDNNDNDNTWADNGKKNSFNNFNKGNKNNNFNKYNNNNKRNFSHNNRNNNNNKKNNNNGTYVSNWGSNNYQNNKNKFGSKGKKNEKRWANELDKNYGETDIKQEKEEGIVDFENYEGFGGYETKNDQNNE